MAHYIAWLVFFLLIIWYSPLARGLGISRGSLLVLFAAKLLAASAITMYYQSQPDYAATADIFKYFRAGQTIASSANESWTSFAKIMLGLADNDPKLFHYLWDSDYWLSESAFLSVAGTRLLVRFHALMSFVSGGNLAAHALAMSFVSLYGLGLLAAWMQAAGKIGRLTSIVLCFLLPSSLLWTSPALKEGLLALGLGLALMNGYRLYWSRKIFSKTMLYLVFGLWILLIMKPYLLGGLAVGCIVSVLYRRVSTLPIFWIIAGLVAGLAGLYILTPLISLSYNDFLALALREHSGSLLWQNAMDGSFYDVVCQLPRGLVSVIAYPLPWQLRGMTDVLPCLEATGMSVLIIWYIVKYRIINAFSLFCIVSALAASVFIGLTVPVLGAIVRYRLPIFWLLGAGLLIPPVGLKIETMFVKAREKTQKIGGLMKALFFNAFRRY